MLTTTLIFTYFKEEQFDFIFESSALLFINLTTNDEDVKYEKDAKKVKKITAKKFVDGIEDACDFVRATAGIKYLIITSEQRKAILAEVRALNPNARVKNNDAEIASEIGVDELIVYTGSKALKPTVLVNQTYHIDMGSLTKVDAFEWKTNENALLLESLSAGKIEKNKSAAVITISTI